MSEKELRERCKKALAEIEDKARQQPLCNLGRGAKAGLEDAAWILRCALDKRHKG